MANNLDIFRKNFFGRRTWVDIKNGIPLDLLDNLSPTELKTAEAELIKSAGLRDDWLILALRHIKSTQALPVLYSLLDKSRKGYKVKIACSIYHICQDAKMADIILEQVPKIKSQYALTSLLYMLPAFKDQRITALLNSYRTHEKYLVAYHATEALGLPTDAVVSEYKQQDKTKSFWRRLFG